MKWVLFVMLACVCINIHAQKNSTLVEDTTVYTVVEEMPEFPGGTKAMMDYFAKNIIYPPEVAACIHSKIYMEFIIDRKGKVIRPKVSAPNQDACPGQQEFFNSVKKILVSMPIWTPGISNGKAVNVKVNVPINICPR